MRQHISLLLSLALIFVLAFGTTSCNKDDQSANFIHRQTVSASEAGMPKITSGESYAPLSVKFDSGIRPFGVKEYRLVLVKSVLSLSFDRKKAQSLDDSRFLKVNPGQKSYQIPITSRLLDNDGDPLRPGVGYKAFVFSVPDNNLTNTGALSAPSFEFAIPNS